MTDGPVLKVAQVAERLGVCNMTIYRLINRGDLGAVKVGKSYRIYESDLVDYLDRSRSRGNPRDGTGSPA